VSLLQAALLQALCGLPSRSNCVLEERERERERGLGWAPQRGSTWWNPHEQKGLNIVLNMGKSHGDNAAWASRET
jgi:hypothetical protein